MPECSIANLLNDRERILIGADTITRGECLVCAPSGQIRIGSHCYIGEHTRIWSSAGVAIGDRVLIAHSVNIHDNDSHPKSATERHLQITKIWSRGEFDLTNVGMGRIVIEDDVWIGFNASIMKGVTIGNGAIIAATTLITRDVPPFAIMAGNPARQIGTAYE